ncbi:MAG: helix-turn-helix domain-containing protein [Pseudomonadota bacterium]
MLYDKKMRTKQAAAYCKLSQSTLAKLRLYGGGPPYSKAGRLVVYDIQDIDQWLDSRKRSSTSAPAYSAHQAI